MDKQAVLLPGQDGKFAGLNIKYDPDSNELSPYQFTDGTINIKTINGSIEKRDGDLTYNVVNPLPEPITDSFNAVFSNGDNQLLVVSSGILGYTTGDGVIDLATSGYTALSNWEFAQFDDRIYMGNGVDDNQIYDRTTSYGGVDYTFSGGKTKIMGCQAPSTEVAPSGWNGDGAIPEGTYTYQTTFLYYGTEESNPSDASTSVTLTAPNDTVTLWDLPIGDYGVTARKIYRKATAEAEYTYIDTVENNTTTSYVDEAATGTVPAPTTNDVPGKFTHMTIWLDRLWGSNGGFTLSYSDAEFPDIFPSTNYITCNAQDRIMGHIVYDEKLYVFNRNSIGYIQVINGTQFKYQEISKSVGCVDNRYINVRIVKGIPILVWASDKGFYSTNGSSIDYISKDVESIVNLDIQQIKYNEGRNIQTTQSDFEAGTRSSGLSIVGGTVVAPTPYRLFDDQTDWEGASSVSSIATKDGSNTIKMPIAKTWTFAEGTVAGQAYTSANLLGLPVAANNTGGGSTAGTGSGYGKQYSEPTVNAVGRPVTFTRGGTITAISALVRNIYYQARLTIWNSAGTPLFYGSYYPAWGGAGGQVMSAACSIAVSAGQTIWMGVECTFTTISDRVYGTGSTPSAAKVYFAGVGWQDRTSEGELGVAYTFTQTAVASAGSWTSPVYDSYLYEQDQSLAVSVTHGGIYPAGCSAITYVDESSSVGMSSVTTQSVNSLNGANSFTWTPAKRFWRVRITMAATDDRYSPTIGAPNIKFPTTAEWISPVIDHTADITSLDSITMTTDTVYGTVTATVATSDDNITYSSYSAIALATPKRYSKIKLSTTCTSDNGATPIVYNLRYKWTSTHTFVSTIIDMLTNPAGFKPFNRTSTGSNTFYMRSATTQSGVGSAAWVAVTNGIIPQVDKYRYSQWEDVMIATDETQAVLDEVIIGWYVGSGSVISRGASIFNDRNYYAAVSEFGYLYNNKLLVYDENGNWHVWDKTAGTFSMFLNAPYYTSAITSDIKIFNIAESEDEVELDFRTKAFDWGDQKVLKHIRQVFMTGSGVDEGATLQMFYSVDGGDTFYPLRCENGHTEYDVPSTGKWTQRFVPLMDGSAPISGKTIMVRGLCSGQEKIYISSMEILGVKHKGFMRAQR